VTTRLGPCAMESADRAGLNLGQDHGQKIQEVAANQQQPQVEDGDGNDFKEEKKPGFLRRLWAKIDVDVPTLKMMFK